MSKKAQNYSKNCFRIRGRQELYIKDEVLVSFTPYRKTKQVKRTSILPTFNYDRRHYTIAFSLPSTEPQPDETMRQDHENRVKQAEAELEELWCPKPRSRHKYCGVCRGYYEDYKEHTQADKHISSLRNSQYQMLINQAALQLRQRFMAVRQEEPGVGQSFSEDHLFKCLSTQTLQEGGSERKVENCLVQS